MAKVFTYTKTPCSVDRLTIEIRQSSILSALDYINLFGTNLDVFFKTDLSSEDIVLLDALVDAHSGEPMPEEEAKAIAVATQYNSYSPSPQNIKIGRSPISVDGNGKMMTRGPIHTDEGTFRDCFNGTSLYTALTGTFSFNNRSDQVIGDGDLSAIRSLYPYIKLGTDDNSCFTQGSVATANDFSLDEMYKGSTGDGTLVYSNWLPIETNGASIAVANSDLILTSGTTSGATASIFKMVDYLPIRFQAKISISQRIANQSSIIGLVNGDRTIVGAINFSGTDNTKVTFITNNGGNDIEETICTLPYGKKSTEEIIYCIEVVSGSCCLLANEVVLATHKDFIPDSYDILGCLLEINNSGTTASSTTVVSDWVSFQNVNQIDVINSFSTVPVKTKLISPATLDGKPLISSTARPVGTYTCITSIADDQLDESKIAGGLKMKMSHIEGDPSEAVLYFDINAIDNETHLQTATLQWKGADFDEIRSSIVPKVTTITDGVGTNYTSVSGILVATPAGYGNKTVDWGNVSLVEMVTNEYGIKPPGYWDATYNKTTKTFENITFNSSGTGCFNIFTQEIEFNSFIPTFIMLGDGIYEFKSTDESRIGHNMRFKTVLTTVGTDHGWKFTNSINLFRKKTC